MPYQVKINDDGTYTVLENGNPVTGAKVTKTSFPEVRSHTLKGVVHHISGSGTADIILPDGTKIIDVPLV